MRRGTNAVAPLAAALATAAMVVALVSPAQALHRHRHRHHVERAPVVEPPPAPPRLQDRAAYQSGFTFGLIDLGISGTPSAISPYVGYGYGTVRPGYDGPGYAYPGY